MGWAGIISGMGRGGHASPRSPLNWPSTPLAEGRGIDGLLSHLIRSGICQLSDVRKNALSHNHDLGGKTMARLCVEVDLAYIHVSALTADDRLFDLCEAKIFSGADDAMASVADPCTRKPSALMCFAALICFLTRLRSQPLKPNCCSLFTLPLMPHSDRWGGRDPWGVSRVSLGHL